MKKVLKWLGIVNGAMLGIVSMNLGVMALGVWAEQTFHFEPLVIIETPFLLLIPIWAVRLGIVVYRCGEKKEPAVEAVQAIYAVIS